MFTNSVEMAGMSSRFGNVVLEFDGYNYSVKIDYKNEKNETENISVTVPEYQDARRIFNGMVCFLLSVHPVVCDFENHYLENVLEHDFISLKSFSQILHGIINDALRI